MFFSSFLRRWPYFVLSLSFIGVVAFIFGNRFKSETRLQSDGVLVEDFALFDHQGSLFELYNLKNSKAIVFFSYDTECPVARKGLAKLHRLQEQYRDQDVRFYLIDADPEDSRQKLIDAAKRFDIRLPILHDETQDVAKSLGMKTTNEIFVVDTINWKVAYQGSLGEPDDEFEPALDSILDGRAFQRRAVPNPGRTIQYQAQPTATFHQHIQPLLETRCAQCHRHSGVAPTHLFSYSDAKGWSKMIREVIRTERMPPWFVDDFYSSHPAEPRLTAEEKRLFYSWIDTGFPEGPSASGTKPPVPAQRRFTGDLVFPMKKEIDVAAVTDSPWHYETLLTDIPEEIWLSGLDFKITNPSIIQHLTLLVTKTPLDLSKVRFTGHFRDKDLLYQIIRWGIALNQPKALRPGMGIRLPKGSSLYLEIHFNLSGRNEREHVTTYLTKYRGSAPPIELLYRPLVQRKFAIPRRTESYRVVQEDRILEDQYIESAGAHMHWRGQRARLIEVSPSGERKTLFSQRYLFKNRGLHQFPEPLLVKAGSILRAEFEFNNSVSNPAKINFNKKVRWGQDDLLNEMATMHMHRYQGDGPHSSERGRR